MNLFKSVALVVAACFLFGGKSSLSTTTNVPIWCNVSSINTSTLIFGSDCMDKRTCIMWLKLGYMNMLHGPFYVFKSIANSWPKSITMRGYLVLSYHGDLLTLYRRLPTAFNWIVLSRLTYCIDCYTAYNFFPSSDMHYLCLSLLSTAVFSFSSSKHLDTLITSRSLYAFVSYRPLIGMFVAVYEIVSVCKHCHWLVDG